MKRFIIFTFCALSGLGVALAAETPSPEEIRSVIEYYYSKKRLAPVLMKSALCKDFFRSGTRKFECTAEIPSKKLSYGSDAYVWLNFFWNKGQSYNVVVNYSLNGVVRRSYDLNLPKDGSIRYRIPLIFHANKKGTWEISVIHAKENDPVKLDGFEIQVE